MSNMQFIGFSEYAAFVEERVAKERYGRFGHYADGLVKRHPGRVWRPIDWCDRCKADLSSGLFFDEETRTALCPTCATGGDKAAFASIGIIFDE